MKKLTCALGPALGFFVAILPGLALAQPDGAPVELTWPVTDTSAMAGPLPPAEILAEARREGFYPISRPVHRGRVYVLFAVDQDDMDVKLTVDATSGRVLWVAGAVARFGGPGYYGYRSLWHSERLVPPAEVPSAGPFRNSSELAGTRHASKRFPPLPRTRPASLAGAVKESTSTVRDQTEPSQTIAPGVTMVPVAPLE